MGCRILRGVDLENLLTINLYQMMKQTCFPEDDVRGHKSRQKSISKKIRVHLVLTSQTYLSLRLRRSKVSSSITTFGMTIVTKGNTTLKLDAHPFQEIVGVFHHIGSGT